MNFAIKSSYIKSLLPNLPDAFIRDKGIVVVPVEEVGFKERVKNDIVLVEAVPEFKPTVVKRDYEDENQGNAYSDSSDSGDSSDDADSQNPKGSTK